MYINTDRWRKILSFAGLFAFVIATCAATPEKRVLDIQHWKTKNGALVYFVATPEVPMVQVNVAFAAGAGRDGDKAGLAQLTNAMLNQGSRNLTADQIAQAFDSVGAQFSASVDRDMGVVGFQSLTNPQYIDKAVDTFTQVLTAPAFPEDAFARTKNQTLIAIDSEKQSPRAIAVNAFYKALYDQQPYHSPMMGTQQTVKALTIADLKQFYQQYYVARNAIIILVGAVTRPEAEALAEKITQNLTPGQAAARLPITMAKAAAQDEKIKFPAEQTTLIMGQVGINYQNPDYFPLIVGNAILGGSVFSSRLFSEVREKKGLVYGINSTFKPLAARGPFAIMLQTRNSEAQQALQLTRDTLNGFVQQGPTEAEIQRMKKQLTNSFPLTLAGNDAISTALLTIGFYHLPLNYLDTYLQKINDVTAEQVKTAFQRTLQPDKMITVQVGGT